MQRLKKKIFVVFIYNAKTIHEQKPTRLFVDKSNSDFRGIFSELNWKFIYKKDEEIV